MSKKILITGATGLIGKSIVSELCYNDFLIRVLSTNPNRAKSNFANKDYVQIFNASDYTDPSKLKDIMEGFDAVINLSGANVAGKRWSDKFKKELYDSRIETTKLIVNAIELCEKKPECLLNASGVGIYGFCGGEKITEDSSLGADFLAKLCNDWEKEAVKAEHYGVRVVRIRTGIVLDKNGGALKEFLKPFKFYFGAYQGSGNQWFSWIHIDDIAKVYIFAMENKYLSGAVNGTSPEPVTNKNLTIAIGKILNRNIILPVPEFLLKIAVGEFAKNLVTGQKVYPQKLLNAGFKFSFPKLENALKDLLKK